MSERCLTNHIQSHNIQITSDPECLPATRQAGEQMAIQIGFNQEDTSRIVLALDEALANVIKHGYGGIRGQPIRIQMNKRIDESRIGLEIIIEDEGKKVDPADIKGRDLDDVRPGGLGVYLIRTIMDIVEYAPADKGMMLRMVKYRAN